MFWHYILLDAFVLIAVLLSFGMSFFSFCNDIWLACVRQFGIIQLLAHQSPPLPNHFASLIPACPTCTIPSAPSPFSKLTFHSYLTSLATFISLNTLLHLKLNYSPPTSLSIHAPTPQHTYHSFIFSMQLLQLLSTFSPLTALSNLFHSRTLIRSSNNTTTNG